MKHLVALFLRGGLFLGHCVRWSRRETQIGRLDCVFMPYLRFSVAFSPSLDDKCWQINWIIVFKPLLQLRVGACACYPPVVGGHRGQSDEFL